MLTENTNTFLSILQHVPKQKLGYYPSTHLSPMLHNNKKMLIFQKPSLITGLGEWATGLATS